MSITIISILSVSAIVWGANKFMPFTVCPICAGVFITWVWLVGALLVGYQVNPIIPALLMGGTVVGIAYQLEKRQSGASVSAILFRKVLFIPTGFVAAYGILEQEWTTSFVAAILLLLIALVPVSKLGASVETKSGLEKKMEDCC